MLHHYFNQATKIQQIQMLMGNIFHPKPAGQAEFFTISMPDIEESATYYFAVRAIDDVGHISPISNIVPVALLVELVYPDPNPTGNPAVGLEKHDPAFTMTVLIAIILASLIAFCVVFALCCAAVCVSRRRKKRKQNSSLETTSISTISPPDPDLGDLAVFENDQHSDQVLSMAHHGYLTYSNPELNELYDKDFMGTSQPYVQTKPVTRKLSQQNPPRRHAGTPARRANSMNQGPMSGGGSSLAPSLSFSRATRSITVQNWKTNRTFTEEDLEKPPFVFEKPPNPYQ